MESLNLNTRYLRYLLAVVEEGSFSRAADRLSVSQPAISRRIRMLEAELGFALLERLPRAVIPTPQGQAMLPAFRDLLRAAADTGNLVEQLLVDRAPVPRIGVAVHTAQVEHSTLLADFETAFPQASFEIETGFTRALLRGLWEGKFDILTVSSALPDERFEYIALQWFPVQLVVPLHSPLAVMATVPVSALKGLSIASWARARQPRIFDELVRPLQDAGAQLIHPDDQGALGLLVHAADHGVATIRSFDEYSEDDIRRVGMTARPIRDMRPVAAAMLLRLAQSKHPRAARLWNFAARWAERRGIPQSRELASPDTGGAQPAAAP